MAYQGIVEDVELHQAFNKLNLGSLQFLDKREVPKAEEYEADPNTESMESTCPACGMYFLFKLWKETSGYQLLRDTTVQIAK